MNLERLLCLVVIAMAARHVLQDTAARMAYVAIACLAVFWLIKSYT